MSAKSTSSNSRFMVKFKALKVRSSKKVCDERLACRGKKPFAVYNCFECGSNQCEECEALLHEDFRLNLHKRTPITGPPWEELCEGSCEDRNFADLTCTECNRNYCYLCDHLFHAQGKQSHPRQKYISQSEEFISCEAIPDDFLPEFDLNEEADDMSDMLSLKSDVPDLFPEHEIHSHYSQSSYKSTSVPKSFLLINDKEHIQVKDSEEFIEKLGCGDKSLKVVSIFGNTGDGKSYTLNHTFFDGEEIFKTSASQESCTVGVWAAHCPSLGIIAIDTEGFLGQASNPNQRARMLLKILAISDIVIYRTRAERLHNDMFSFLGDASAAYTKHFSQELEETSVRCNVDGPLSVLLQTCQPCMKILAISDIVIYRTRAERLHNDMFSFLGDASAAYTKHFSQELEETSVRCNVDGPLSVLLQTCQPCMKILAISDIVIYRTRAERLHNDMFSFLGDASAAYTKHFSQELEEASVRCNVDGPLSVLGPAVILFHETQFTHVLSKDGYNVEPELYLRSRFQELGLKVDAFCSIEYLGTCSDSGPTDFRKLRQKISKHVQNSNVRVARSPAIVYKVLKVLNDKFCGNIDKALPNTFPDQYFTCCVYCKSCKSRCSNSMNHEKDNIPHVSVNNCIYQHQYENKIFLCKACFERGEKVQVSPKTMESNESSLVGFAKYAWSGYILECDKCGVIYRSRQYWYGNQNPWETCVRTEICHVWPKADGSLTEEKNTAQYVIDNLSTVSEVVSSIGAKPTKVLTSWVADQIAPSYWIPNSRITHCGLCEAEFTDLDTKHHCRICGGGFCENCAFQYKVVPTWGSSPVRVCEKCYKEDPTPNVQTLHNPPEVTVRKIGEAVHTTLGTVASAVSFPLGIIKDSARPTYWVPDHLLKNCSVCENEFGPKLSIHHCRACGEGVCDNCSKSRKPVPSRGWNYNVRVCNSCIESNSF